MAHLTKPALYDIEDSNIALLGSDLEKRVREKAGDGESAWTDTGKSVGVQIWHIENFHVVPWPEKRKGSFYDGDSYIVLHTYKRTPESKSLSYDLHFWLGKNTTQDEAGTAAYKTVELDDHLHGKPVQYREVQGYESARFLSYFPAFVCLQGGVASGFHHVSDLPPPGIRKLYRVNLSRTPSGHSNLIVREVPCSADSLIAGDVYVLDKGTSLLQFNTKGSAGQERFKAAEFVQELISVGNRNGHTDLTVYDEGDSGAGRFLQEFGAETTLRPAEVVHPVSIEEHPILFHISDSTGVLTFEKVQRASRSSLSSDDAYLLDKSAAVSRPAVFVWIGHNASLNEQRLSLQYAQRYLHEKRMTSDRVRVVIPIVKMREGEETADFLEAI